MKIAIVNERIEVWRGGAETSGMEIASLLAERGHDVHIFTTTNAQDVPGISIHTVSPSRVLRTRRMVSFLRRVGEAIAREGCDVVHAISPMPTADVYQPRGGLLPEIVARNVATRPTASRRLFKRAMLAMNVKQRSQVALERRIFREGGPVIACVSEYVARQCREHYGAPEDRIRVIFNGVNPAPLSDAERASQRADMRKELGVADDELLLLFLAHNYRLKGINPLIEAIARLVGGGFKSFRLLVAGRDNVVPYKRRVDAMGLEKYVTFTGPTKRATRFYAGADVCVHPTFYDPCSRVILEALYYGLPSITTAYNGASEVIRDGSNGFVIDRPDDSGLLARRIQDLASPTLREQFSINATAIRERIGMRRHVSELESLFEETLERKGKRLSSGV
ncbi:MAG TPA: glycosyltransferase family 4 protein [Phycisphaerae bacterium]|nr:glycosyltransferase family 4 protein [Phycisphaerae bacterium]HRW52933.1 glycosyltransferase family 4 protein [Phycisphaerae bacterium]